MTSTSNRSKSGRWSASAVFVASWAAVLCLAIVVALVGILLAGGAEPFRQAMDGFTPYALVWRLVLYVVGGTLYLNVWRPRLRAAQDAQGDAGVQSHTRLVRVERMLLIAIVAVEAANLPDLLGYFGG